MISVPFGGIFTTTVTVIDRETKLPIDTPIELWLMYPNGVVVQIPTTHLGLGTYSGSIVAKYRSAIPYSYEWRPLPLGRGVITSQFLVGEGGSANNQISQSAAGLIGPQGPIGPIGPIGPQGPPGAGLQAYTGTTIGNTTATLVTVPIPVNGMMWIDVLVMGRRTDADGYCVKGYNSTWRRVGSGAPVQTDAAPFEWANLNCAAPDMSAVVNGNSVNINVNGALGATISWTTSHAFLTTGN